MTRIYIDKPDAIGFEDECGDGYVLFRSHERGVVVAEYCAPILSPANTRLLAAKLAGWAGKDEEKGARP